MDDDLSTYGMCHLRLRTPDGRTEAEKEDFREEVERVARLNDGQTMLSAAGDFNAHTGVVEPGDEENIGRFGWGTWNREGRELVEMPEELGWRSWARYTRRRSVTKSPTGADDRRQSSTYC